MSALLLLLFLVPPPPPRLSPLLLSTMAPLLMFSRRTNNYCGKYYYDARSCAGVTYVCAGCTPVLSVQWCRQESSRVGYAVQERQRLLTVLGTRMRRGVSWCRTSGTGNGIPGCRPPPSPRRSPRTRTAFTTTSTRR